MKFLIASIAALMTVQAVRVQREAVSVSAAQSKFDPYSSTEIFANQQEVKKAQA